MMRLKTRRAQRQWQSMLDTLREVAGWDEDDVLHAIGAQGEKVDFVSAIKTICMAIRAGMSSAEFCLIATEVREAMAAGQTGGVVTTDFGVYGWGDAA